MSGVEAFDMQWDNKCRLAIDSNTEYSDILKRFSSHLLTDLTRTSTTAYVRIISRFLLFTNKSLEDLDIDDYSLFMNQFKLKTPQYQIQIYQALKRFSTYLRKKRISPIDMMADTKSPNRNEERITTKQKREHGYLTEDEIKSCIYNASHGVSRINTWNIRNEAIVRLFLTTGIRVSAMYKLDIHDLTLYETDGVLEGGSIVVYEKGSKSYQCDFNANVAQALKAWLIDRDKKLKGFTGADTEALFISKVRHRMTQQALDDLIRNVAIKQDGTHLSPHKLRASYGTFLYNQTNDIYLVQQALHHTNPKTSEKYIRGVQDDTKKRIKSVISY